jgi:hypothetical protein
LADQCGEGVFLDKVDHFGFIFPSVERVDIHQVKIGV